MTPEYVSKMIGKAATRAFEGYHAIYERTDAVAQMVLLSEILAELREMNNNMRSGQDYP